MENNRKRDKIWFAGHCFDVQTSIQPKKQKKVSIERSESINKSRDNSTIRNELKPW